MTHIFSVRNTAIYLLCIFALLVLFHLGIISGVLPDNIVWADRFPDRATLVKMEMVSVTVLILAAIPVAIKGGLLNWRLRPMILQGLLWLLLLLFLLNTLGNATAPHPVEKYGFGVLTFLIMLLLGRLLKG
jgi:hypothetical protein